MAKFKLVSPYEPTGDQPQAIEKLVEGVLKGYRYQTLLGVTGSGKSVIGSTPVLISSQDRSGRCTYSIVQIGALVDQILSDSAETLKLGDTLIHFASKPYRYYTLSLNPLTCESELKPITAFIRHNSP